MTTAISCVVGVLHRNGRHLDMMPFGDEPGRRTSGDRCGDCGVIRGGCRFDEDGPDEGFSLVEPMGVDGNGRLTERMWFGDQEVIIHRDDYPPSDLTTIAGIRCTTPLRTVIDVAPEVSTSDLEVMVRDCLERELFTVEEAWRRLAEPDMVGMRGADMLHRVLTAFEGDQML